MAQIILRLLCLFCWHTFAQFRLFCRILSGSKKRKGLPFRFFLLLRVFYVVYFSRIRVRALFLLLRAIRLPAMYVFSAEFYSAFSPSISAGFDPARRTLHLRKQQRRRYDHSAILADYRIMPDEKGGRHRIAQPVHLQGGNLLYLEIRLKETLKTLPRHAVFHRQTDDTIRHAHRHILIDISDGVLAIRATIRKSKYQIGGIRMNSYIFCQRAFC